MYSLRTDHVLATYRFALLTHFETADSVDNSDIPCNSGVASHLDRSIDR